MPVRELPRIPAEEMEKLKASKYVESVDTHTQMSWELLM